MISAGIEVTWVETLDGFLALEPSWRALHDASDAGPFLQWEWISAAWEELHPRRAPRIAVANDRSGRLLGILPLSEERRAGLRVWRFAADETVGSDYLDAIVLSGREPETLHALWSALDHRQTDFDRLELLDLPRESASLRWLGPLFPEAVVEARYRCPAIAIEGTFAHYLAGRPRRDNLLRRRKWLAAQPGFRIDVAREPGHVSAALDDFFHLHRLRWASDGGSQGITGPAIEAFHRRAAPALAAQGRARVYTLRLGEKAIASVYLLCNGPRWSFYQSGYDPAHANRSPGLVLLARTIEDAFIEGARVYDFLRGEEAYKKEWATTERFTVAITAAGRSIPARLYEGRRRATRTVKAALRTLLPEALVAELQRRRRQLARGAGHKGAGVT